MRLVEACEHSYGYAIVAAAFFAQMRPQAAAINMVAHFSLNLAVKCIATIEGERAYNGSQRNRRVHSALPDPLHVRITFVTDTGAASVVSFWKLNPALDVVTEDTIRAKLGLFSADAPSLTSVDHIDRRFRE